MVRVYRCQCGTSLKVLPEWLGRTGNCTHCGKTVQFTIQNTVPVDSQAFGAPTSPPPSTPPPAAVRSDEPAAPIPTPGSGFGADVSEMPDSEELLVAANAAREAQSPGPPPPPSMPLHAPEPPAYARSTSPMPPPPPRSAVMRRTATGSLDISQAFDLALDWRKLVVPIVVFLAWAILSAIVLTLLDKSHSERAMLGYLVVTIPAVVGIATGAISRMVHLEIDERRSVPIGEAWAFVRERFAGLAIVCLGLLIVASVCALAANFGAAKIVSIPKAGEGFRAILLLPLFLVNLTCFSMILCFDLVACVMAVDSCGPGMAIMRFYRLFSKRRGQILSQKIRILGQLLMLLAAWGSLIFGALFVSVAACTSDAKSGFAGRLDEYIDKIVSGEGGLAVWTVDFIVALIGSFLLAYLYTYFVAAGTILYKTVRLEE